MNEKRRAKYKNVMFKCEEKAGEELFSLDDILNLRKNFNLKNKWLDIEFEKQYYREQLIEYAVELRSLGVDLNDVTIRTAYKKTGVERILYMLGANPRQMENIKPSYRRY